MSRELHSYEAEHAILGALMLADLQKDAGLVDQILEKVERHDFHGEDTAALFQAIVDLREEGVPVDPVTLGDIRPTLPSGEVTMAFAGTLAQRVPSTANWKAYAKTLRERAVLRNVIAAARTIEDLATEDRPVAQIIARAQQAMADLRDLDDEGPQFKRLAEVILKVTDRLDDGLNDRLPKWPDTGLIDLDHLLRGIRPKKITVIAGLPGSGKTTLALQIAQHNAVKRGEPWLVFSLEMPEEELGIRAIASLGGVDLKRLDDPKALEDDDWTRISAAAGQALEAPLFICDDPSVTPTRIRAISRRCKREHGLAGIVIDYLGLIPADSRGRSRAEEVGAVNKALLRLAKELDVPVIELAQLNRESTKRAGKAKRPQSSDLRDSGEIEADASCILMVHRDPDTEEGAAGVTEILMTKCRHAPVGMCRLQQQGQYGRFASLAGYRETSQEEVEMGRPFAGRYAKGGKQ
jgi:replicative DNA helicase